MTNKFGALLNRKPLKTLRAKRNVYITSLTLSIEIIKELKLEEESLKCLVAEESHVESELTNFLNSNKAFVNALLVEDVNIDQSTGFKADQDIFVRNVKEIKMAISTKWKELKEAGLTLPETVPTVDANLVTLIQSLKESNEANADAIKILATGNSTASASNTDAIKALVAGNADASEKTKEAIEKLANTGR